MWRSTIESDDCRWRTHDHPRRKGNGFVAKATPTVVLVVDRQKKDMQWQKNHMHEWRSSQLTVVEGLVKEREEKRKMRKEVMCSAKVEQDGCCWWHNNGWCCRKMKEKGSWRR